MMMEKEPWELELEKVMNTVTYEEREAKINRILSDPKPEYAPPAQKDYAVTEKHYIYCVDEAMANASMPEAFEKYGALHTLGAFLVSDRLELPLGWEKSPGRGVSIETIKEKYPEVYEIFKEKKMSTF